MNCRLEQAGGEINTSKDCASHCAAGTSAAREHSPVPTHRQRRSRRGCGTRPPSRLDGVASSHSLYHCIQAFERHTRLYCCQHSYAKNATHKLPRANQGAAWVAAGGGRAWQRSARRLPAVGVAWWLWSLLCLGAPPACTDTHSCGSPRTLARKQPWQQCQPARGAAGRRAGRSSDAPPISVAHTAPTLASDHYSTRMLSRSHAKLKIRHLKRPGTENDSSGRVE